jgi:hypothetical protein
MIAPTRARARLDRMTDACFDLDPAAHTARLRTICSRWHVPRMPPFDGVPASIEPWISEQ